ncbi:MAG: hypothetical protein EKK41_02795 [Hyphomicrobiales bacterium]|nr:MAG: hypothetical protein EKK41_02795 [Hyphomicrobiales bacterium]
MRLFFHVLADAGQRIEDPEGQEFANVQDAFIEASCTARELAAEELRQGRCVPTSWRIELVDETGRVLLSQAFRHLVLADSCAATA